MANKKKVGRPKKKTTGFGLAFALLKITHKYAKSGHRKTRVARAGGTFR